MDFLTNFFISCKESRIENNKSFYGCFHIGPFEPGQSLTIANALRRTLLSELKGIAITGVEIDGALHEYSNLVGVKDSVLDILLNFKEIILRKRNNFNTSNNFWRISTFNSPFLESKNRLFGKSKILKSLNSFSNIKAENVNELKSFAYLKVRGPGVVRASDLRLPPNIQCVDPDQYIATLTEDGSLNIKITIEEGEKFIESLNITLFDTELRSDIEAEVPITTNKLKNTLISNIDKLIPQKILSQKYESLLNNSIPLKNLNGDTHADTLEMSSNESFSTDMGTFVSINDGLPLNNFEHNLIGSMPGGPLISLEKPSLSKKKTTKGRQASQTNLLKIDAVFNPVTKVNYTIEIQEHEKINRHFESVSNLQQTLDILNATPFNQIKTFKVGNKKFLQILLNLTHKNKIKAGWDIQSSPALKKIKSVDTQISKKHTKSSLKQKNRENLISFVGKASPLTKNGDAMNFLNEPTSIKHKIILEIWTNGSVHPRQALQIALNNLVNIFIKLQKTQIYTYNRVAFKGGSSKLFFKDLELNNTYTLSRNTKDLLFQKWLSKYIHNKS